MNGFGYTPICSSCLEKCFEIYFHGVTAPVFKM